MPSVRLRSLPCTPVSRPLAGPPGLGAQGSQGASSPDSHTPEAIHTGVPPGPGPPSLASRANPCVPALRGVWETLGEAGRLQVPPAPQTLPAPSLWAEMGGIGLQPKCPLCPVPTDEAPPPQPFSGSGPGAGPRGTTLSPQLAPDAKLLKLPFLLASQLRSQALRPGK